MKNYKLVSKETNETLFAGFYKDFKTCLEEAVVRRIPLFHADLRNKNLCNANLDDGIFGHADFSGSNLTGTNLSESYCQNANFTNTSLYNACLAYSNLRNANLQGASFGATDITNAIIDGVQFSTLSAFNLNFFSTRQMQNCIFISHEGAISRMSKPPIVIHGLNKAPLIMTDDAAHIGHKKIQNARSLLAIEKLATRKTKKHVDLLNRQA